jgi:hypothetical protein
MHLGKVQELRASVCLENKDDDALYRIGCRMLGGYGQLEGVVQAGMFG